eukprot:TRINITY_DN12154_c0_g1_i1.p1 TRINITY_DN12154_c0_g1~~TRINITY_DN12154_c0_g1_i1.p1  ORF type:complete len:111 (-),score=9.45 TRINITY_DN12154_c0_g1_i1:207-539(-)
MLLKSVLSDTKKASSVDFEPDELREPPAKLRRAEECKPAITHFPLTEARKQDSVLLNEIGILKEQVAILLENDRARDQRERERDEKDQRDQAARNALLDVTIEILQNLMQ